MYKTFEKKQMRHQMKRTQIKLYQLVTFTLYQYTFNHGIKILSYGHKDIN